MRELRKPGKSLAKRKTSRLGGAPRNALAMSSIKQRMEQFVKREGRRPRILVSDLKAKDHNHESKLTASILAESGFDVDISPPHQTPQIIARMAVENDVHIVCLQSSGNMHAEMVANLSEALSEEGGKDIQIVIGGSIPETDHHSLYDAGVVLILNSSLVDAVSINRLLDLFE